MTFMGKKNLQNIVPLEKMTSHTTKKEKKRKIKKNNNHKKK